MKLIPNISSGRIPDFIINAVTGPALLALPVYLILLLLIKVDHNPFIAEVVEQTLQNDENIHVYSFRDITGDEISEQILILKNLN